MNNSSVESAKKGEEVCIKIENTTGAPRLIGRHFEATDELVTRISRNSSSFYSLDIRVRYANRSKMDIKEAGHVS